jgi:uncharacterized membrane protein YcgQ (UPF0703/DUF1980 family)
MSGAHHHGHTHDTDTYYLDQLCMIGLTGAFSAICLTLYFFKTGMLNLLLTDQFHPYVLAAGIALAIVTLVRATVLWRASGKTGHHHDHAHGHDDHSHGACGHDHGACDHDHGEHGHHHHDHDHDHAGHTHEPQTATVPLAVVEHQHAEEDDGHDHGWAPWRYIVLLIPLMLFLLGVPNKAMPLANAGQVDMTREAASVMRFMAACPVPMMDSFAGRLHMAASAGTFYADEIDRTAPIFIDGSLGSIRGLQPGMNVAIKLAVDRDVVGNLGAAEIWAVKSGDAPVKGSPSEWTQGQIRGVDTAEKSLTVAINGKDETFDLEAATGLPFKTLESMASNSKIRDDYNGKRVQVTGEFAPFPNNDRVFSLARRKMQCCAADAIQLNVPIVSRESFTGYKSGDWVRVTGRVQFREKPGMPGVYQTVLIVNRAANIVRTVPDIDPYIK